MKERSYLIWGFVQSEILVVIVLTDDDKAMMAWGKLQRTYTQLNLSNKQTIKAQEIIINGMQEINAIQYDIKAKEGQIEVIKRTRIAPQA